MYLQNGRILGNMNGNSNFKAFLCKPGFHEENGMTQTRCRQGNWTYHPHCIENGELITKKKDSQITTAIPDSSRNNEQRILFKIYFKEFTAVH